MFFVNRLFCLVLKTQCSFTERHIFLKPFQPKLFRDAVGLMNLRLSDGGKYDREIAPALLAHEMGHMMGAADHDGQGVAKGCQGKYIMTPSVGYGHNTWSYCSR